MAEDLLSHLHEPEMSTEYDAWQTVVREWHRVIPESMNDSKFDPLIRAVEVWGERLTALRLTQTEEERRRAVEDRLLAYNSVVIR